MKIKFEDLPLTDGMRTMHDTAPATRPAAVDTEPLTEKEKLDIFLRVHGREFPDSDTEMSWARFTNRANLEKYVR
jgi:hypothetical protein